MPQGSVLGPLLFNIFVDDLDNALHQDVKIKKFADDTKLYIVYSADACAQAALKLQESLNAVQTWCNQWSMQLNVSKCTSMFFGCNNPRVTYMLNGCALAHASTMRDLGVTVSDTACFSQQCLTVSSKARRLTGLMLRTFSSRRRSVIVPMLKAIIRPIVEYATPTWNPCLKKDIDEVERVQRKVTKCIRGISHLSYEERIRSLDLPKLETRRLYFDMLECYKIVHNLTRSECHSVISLSQLRTRGYHCRLKSTLPPARTELRKQFFLERALSQWNALPAEVVQQQAYNSFKQALRKHLFV